MGFFKGWCSFKYGPLSSGISWPAVCNNSNSCGITANTKSWLRLSVEFGCLVPNLDLEIAVVFECRAFISLVYHSALTGGSSARRIKPHGWFRSVWGMIFVMLNRLGGLKYFERFLFRQCLVISLSFLKHNWDVTDQNLFVEALYSHVSIARTRTSV